MEEEKGGGEFAKQSSPTSSLLETAHGIGFTTTAKFCELLGVGVGAGKLVYLCLLDIVRVFQVVWSILASST